VWIAPFELANLTMKHTQQRDNRWCTVDLVEGTGGANDPDAGVGEERD